MAVMIRNMSMPNSCSGCDLANFFTDQTPYCRRVMKAVNLKFGRPSWCPLVEVKVPKRGDAELLEASNFEL